MGRGRALPAGTMPQRRALASACTKSPDVPPRGGGASDPRALDEHPAAEGREDLRRDGPGLAGADDAAVELDHRDDLRAGTGEEALVRHPDVVAGHVRLADRHVELLREVEDRAAGNALERALRRGRGDELALVDDEDVVRGALRDIPPEITSRRNSEKSQFQGT